MITKTTELSPDYFALFDEIYEKSGGSLKIENLEQFFGNIQEIKDLDEKFLRMPLDEPRFEIDANTRKIKVEATPFKTNGVAVQGDHLAEIISFEIDKYFDIMDLMNTEIYINWKMGAETGKDECFIKSDTIIPGKIIFGWPISKAMTQKSGSLEFAVQLEVIQDGQVAYSLNTLVATLPIKDGLVLTNPTSYDMGKQIHSILFNSSFGEDSAVINNLVWVSGNGEGLVEDINNNEYSPIINLIAIKTDDGNLVNTPKTLYGLAAAGREAVVMYSDDNKAPADTRKSKIKTVFIQVADGSVLLDNVNYYVNITEDTYVVANQADLDKFVNEEGTLFVKAAAIVLDRAGKYYINAQGVKYATVSEKELVEDGAVLSDVITYFVKKENGEFVEATEDDKESFTLGLLDLYRETSKQIKVGASSVLPCDIIEVPEAVAPGEVSIIAPILEDVEKYEFDNNGKTVYLSQADNNIRLTAKTDLTDFGLLSFVWVKDGVELDSVNLGFGNSNESSVVLSEEGTYKVIAKHYRNGSPDNLNIKSTESDEYLISHLATPIEARLAKSGSIIQLTKSTDGSYIKGNTGSFNINYNFVTAPVDEGAEPAPVYSDEVVFQLLTDDDNFIPASFENDASNTPGVKVCTVNSANIKSEGNFKIQVSNKYNGSIYSVITDKIYINISAPASN